MGPSQWHSDQTLVTHCQVNMNLWMTSTIPILHTYHHRSDVCPIDVCILLQHRINFGDNVNTSPSEDILQLSIEIWYNALSPTEQTEAKRKLMNWPLLQNNGNPFYLTFLFTLIPCPIPSLSLEQKIITSVKWINSIRHRIFIFPL